VAFFLVLIHLIECVNAAVHMTDLHRSAATHRLQTPRHGYFHAILVAVRPYAPPATLEYDLLLEGLHLDCGSVRHRSVIDVAVLAQLMCLIVLRGLLWPLLSPALGSFLLLRIRDDHVLWRVVTAVVSDVL
jgi:hypothetical protein